MHMCTVCLSCAQGGQKMHIVTGVGEPPFESWELSLGLLQEAANALNC